MSVIPENLKLFEYSISADNSKVVHCKPAYGMSLRLFYINSYRIAVFQSVNIMVISPPITWLSLLHLLWPVVRLLHCCFCTKTWSVVLQTRHIYISHNKKLCAETRKFKNQFYEMLLKYLIYIETPIVILILTVWL